MAEHVVIKIDIDADTYEVDRVRAKLEGLRLEAETLDKHMMNLSGHSDELHGRFVELDKELDKKSKDFDHLSGRVDHSRDRFERLTGSLKKNKKELGFFDKVFKETGEFLQKFVKFSLKAFVVNLGLQLAALLAVNLAFKAGAAAAKVWNASLIAGAAAGASALAVLSGVVAAQRQYQAALSASQYGGGLKGATAANTQLRELQQNTKLASLGAEALAGAFASISAHTQMNGVLQRALTAMGDFAVASGDPTKGLQAAGEFLGLLVKKGSLTKEVLDAAAEVGPQFVDSLSDALKNKRIKNDSKSILEGLMGGAFQGDAVGNLDVVSGTLMGGLKSEWERLKSSLADMGQNFLPEFTTAVHKMGNLVSTALMKISGAITQFAGGSLVDGLTSGVERLTNWTTDLFLKKLPHVKELWASFKDGLSGVSDWFHRVVESMRPLLDGAKVLTHAFGPVFKQIWQGFTGGVKGLGDLLVGNKDTIQDLADGVGRFLESMGHASTAIKEAFFDLLPVLTTILDVVSNVADAIADILHMFKSVGSAIGGIFGNSGTGGRIGSGLGVLGLILGYAGLGEMGKIGKMGAKKKFAKGVGGSSGLIGESLGTVTMTANIVNLYSGTPPMSGGGGSSGTSGGGVSVAKAGGLAGFNTRFTKFMNSPTGMALRGVAGIAGAGIMTNARTTKGSVTGGAITGAALGAGLGIPGMLAGGVIGGVGGFAYDKIWGDARRNKEQAEKTAAAVSQAAMERITEDLNKGRGGNAKKELNDLKTRLAYYGEIVSGTLDLPSKPGRLGDVDGPNVTLYNGAGDAHKKMEGLFLTQEEIDSLTDAPGHFYDNFKEFVDGVSAEATPAIASFDDNIERLSYITGMSEDKLSDLAATLGKDLTDGVVSVQFAVEELLGVKIPQAADMAMARLDSFLAAVDNTTLPIIDQQEALQAVNQDAADLYDKVKSGAATQADYAEFLRQASTYELGATRDPITGETDPRVALDNMMRKFGGNGGWAFQPGEVFGGQGDTMAAIFQPMLQQIQQDWIKQHGRELLGRIATDFSDKSGGTASLDLSGVSDATFAAMDLNDLDTLQKILDDGILDKVKNVGPQYGDMDWGKAIMGILQGLDVPGLKDVHANLPGAQLPPGATPQTVENTAGNALLTAANTLDAAGFPEAAGYLREAGNHLMQIAMAPPIVNTKVDVRVDQAGNVTTTTDSSTITPTGTTIPGAYVPKPNTTKPSQDTSTPPNGTVPGGDTATSRLAGTLKFHSALNPRLAGKRTVTSALRNYNLGSLGSDHANGFAYDLVGDNLGAYAKTVSDLGGFAEVHGRGADRHLHVVPPHGDTASPAVASPNASGDGGVTILHVYPSPGMDETTFAHKVVNILDKRNRNIRERTSG